MKTTVICLLLWSCCLNINGQDIFLSKVIKQNTSLKSYYINFDRTLLPFGYKDTIYQKNCEAYVHQTDSNCYFRVITPRNYSYIIDEPSGTYYYEVRNQTLFTNFKHRGASNELFSPYFKSYYNFIEKECRLISNQEDNEHYILTYTSNVQDSNIQSFTKELYINKADTTVQAETWFGSDKALGPFYNKVKINRVVNFPNAIDSILLQNQPITIAKMKDKNDADRKLSSTDTFFINKRFENIIYNTTDGKRLELKNENANFYIIDFSFLACRPCLILHKKLATELNYLTQNKIKVLTLNAFDTDTSKINTYLKNSEIPFNMYLINKDILKKYDVTTFPKVFILDKNYTILKVFSGYNDTIMSYIKEIMR